MSTIAKITTSLAEYGIQPEQIKVGHNQFGADLAIACFAMTTGSSQTPQLVAQSLAKKITNPAFSKLEALNGYVNIWLEPKFVLGELRRLRADQADFGACPANGKTVIIEYVSANIAKPLSAGHLKNALQGRALVNLYQTLGYKVVTDNHLGDWGTVFGIWVTGFEKFSNHQKLKKDGLKELGSIYVKMRKALKEEAADEGNTLAKAVQAKLLALEAGDQQMWGYHKRFTQISLKHIRDLLTQLDIQFDETLGESFYQTQARQLLKELEQSGLAQRQADTSLVIDLSAQGIDTPFLLQKSNGASLYATSDIATLKYRQERWTPHQVIYVVGNEQRFYFRQLFAFNHLAGYTSAELIHHSFGLVEELDQQGARHKLSSRKGAVTLESILERARSEAKALAKEGMTKQDIDKLALGALTFREFSQHPSSNVLFDWREMFNLSGFSGPYVQYAAVRLKSILAKAQTTPQLPDSDYDWQPEHKLLVSLLRYPDILQEAHQERAVFKLAFHIYDLAKEINRYYEQTMVLDDDQRLRQSRLWLANTLYQHFVHVLGILGIKVPATM